MKSCCGENAISDIESSAGLLMTISLAKSFSFAIAVLVPKAEVVFDRLKKDIVPHFSSSYVFLYFIVICRLRFMIFDQGGCAGMIGMVSLPNSYKSVSVQVKSLYSA
ncbi:hypothetical protein R103_E11516 [Saccharomyces cerevisiae R103]|uniref:EC1118_1E8_2410p n=1 Tax=Saccharomyces cerevisiae (strain Lalvin EC1118 / Prise de mousse) TaxID=643680 RepID=C8Z7C6_YEAS8|nr:hypothetical protein R103_E11516 [Saccharomyces cerevisiae R103]CAY79292.1 EC1118_1E8_2410p [Saccharomyces cerevisiae EC1118]